MTAEKIVGILFLTLIIIDGLYMIKQIVSMACVSDYDGRKKIIIAFILMIVLGAASIICKQFI